MAFSGWPEEALDFYDGLAADNTKTYWTEHKTIYTDKVLGPMTELTEELAAEFGEPKIFRPYRDVRFSPDKTPYKTHIGAVVGCTGYVQLSAEGLAAGVGLWQMSPEQLARYRAAVAADRLGAELEKIIATIEQAPAGSAWAVGTELNLVQRLAHDNPDKTIVFLDKTVCYCSTMNRIDLPHLVWAMESLADGHVVNQITVDPQTAGQARTALNQMLALP